MKKGESTNTFLDGLVMDFNPMVTPNTMLTNALNATLLTYNGNENALLNDMGNGRVETAFLPEGFIPVGTTSFGGIVYVASYNPLTNQSQIGSFPSPERNILSTELNIPYSTLSNTNFYKDGTDLILNSRYKLILFDEYLNPGDKFQIFSENIKDFLQYISGVHSKNMDINKYPKYLKLHIISVDLYGKITYLDDGLVWYPTEEDKYFYIKCSDIPNNPEDTDLDEYRNLVNANYSVFQSANKGKLGILAELECITSFDASYSASVENIESDKYDREVTLSFDLNWTYENNNIHSQNLINLYSIEVVRSDEDSKFNNAVCELSFEYNNEKNLEEYIILNYDNLFTINESPTEGDTDILEKSVDYGPLPDVFYNKIDDINYIRNNNGIDPQYTTSNFLKIKYNSEIEDNYITLRVIPKMPFGKLSYLTKDITINLYNLGKDITKLVEWKYYVNNSSVTLNWGLDYYPLEGKKISSIDFNFYSLNKVSNLTSIIDSKEFLTKENENENLPLLPKNSDYKLSIVKNSYSGHFTETIDFSNLKGNSCYLTEIAINYDKEVRYYYRILYTIPIFNERYFERDDFSELLLFEFEKNIFYFAESPINNTKIINEGTTYWYNTFSNEDEEIKILDSKELTISGQYLTEKIENIYKIWQQNNLKFNIDLDYNIKSTYSLFDNIKLKSKAETFGEKILLKENAKKVILNDYEESLDEIDDLNKSEVKLTVNVLEDNIINIKGNSTRNILTPFYFDYQDSLGKTSDYVIEPVSSSSLYKAEIHYDKSALHIENSGGLLISIKDNGTSINAKDSGLLSNWIDNYSSDADIINIYWEKFWSNCDWGCIISDGSAVGSKVYNTSSPSQTLGNGSAKDYGYTEKSHSNNSNTQDLFNTLLLKGNSSLYFIIYSYRKTSSNVYTSNIEDKFKSLYKWKAKSLLINLYEISNINYYDTYDLELLVKDSDKNISVTLESYSINKYNIKYEDISKAPKNLLLYSISCELPTISKKYRIDTNKIIRSLIKNLGLIFYDPEHNLVYYDFNINIPVEYTGNELKESEDFNIDNFNIKFKVDEGKLIVTDFKSSHNACVYFWCEDKGNTQKGKWISPDGKTGGGLIVRFLNMYIVS